MKCSLGISNFLEEISSLSHSVVFLCFFALITEEGFLISPCYSLEFWIQMGVSFLFSFPFPFLFFSQLFVNPPQAAILLFAFLFLGMVLIPVSYTMSGILVHISSSHIKGTSGISRGHWGQFKGVQALHTPWSLSATPPLNHCYQIFPSRNSFEGLSLL